MPDGRESLGDASRWPGVSVIIPVRNEPDALRDALRSIVEQDYPGPVEVLVADGSDDADPVRAAVRGFPGVRVVRNVRGIAPPGLNLALQAAAHPVFARCDARCVLPPGYLRRAVQTMMDTGAVNVGGRQHPVGSGLFQRAVAVAMGSLLGSGGARYRHSGPAGSVDTVFLGVYRRDAVLQVGGFDDAQVRSADYELNWRLREAGGVVWYDPALVVSYGPRRTLAGLARQYFDYGRFKRVTIRRWPKSLRLRQALPPLLTVALASSGALGLAGALGDCPGAVTAAGVAPAGYAAVLTAGTAVALARRRDAAALLLPILWAAMHLAWGLGFLFGPRRGRGGAPGQWPHSPGSGRSPTL